ncbi:MAG: SpoIIE family protein phosphatase [Cytophagales bacterium]|nr:SpoIIE family protein phosphatase [Cytophagales bacterium]MDW8384534.1 SpoIIE family protein phosphatase [Flammeovirgaceae bacterium]
MCFLLLVLIVHLAHSQANFEYLTQYTSHYYGAEEGFLSASVTGIEQDNHGFLWITSESGLYRFDGFQFKEYSLKDFPYLDNNFFAAIQKDEASGKLWIATRQNGLISYQDFNFQGTDSFSLHQFQYTILTIHLISKGVLIGTQKNGLWIYQNGVYQKLSISSEIDNSSITAIAKSTLGSIWIAVANRGIYRLKSISRERCRIDAFYQDSSLNNVYALISNLTYLWAATSHGFVKVVGNSLQLIESTQNIPIYHCLQDTLHKNFWLATAKGIAKYNYQTNSIHWLTPKQGLNFEGCRYLFIDREKTIWGASSDIKGELVQLIGGKFLVYSIHEGLPSNYIHRVIQLQKDCVLIISHAHDITILTPHSQYNITFSDTIQDAIFVGNHYYIAGNILYKTQPDLKILQKIPEIIHPYYLYTDRKQSVWIATPTYLFKISEVHHPLRVADIKEFYVYKIEEDNEGNLLLATSKGFFKLSSSQQLANLYNSHAVYSFLQVDSRILLATHHGIQIFHPNGPKIVPVNLKLPTDIIYDIVTDSQGRFWISTAKGIAELGASFLQANQSAEPSRFLDVRDGLRSAFFQYPIHIQLDSVNNLWIYTDKGLHVLKTDDIVLNYQKPAISIYGFWADNQLINVTNFSKVSIPPGVNRFEIDYAVVSLLNPSKVRIKYKLEGFDIDWREVETERKAIYTNLPSGNYTFKVIACNADNIWNLEGKSISFHYQPYFYKTTLFYVIVAFLISIVAIYFYRSKIQIHKKRSEDLMRIVVRRTNELAHQKRQIEQQKEEIEHAYYTISTVSQIGQKVTSTLNLQEIIATVRQNLKSLMPTEIFSIGFLDELNTSLEIQHFLEGTEPKYYFKEYLDNTDSPFVRSVVERKPLIVSSDVKNSFTSEPESALYVPLTLENRAIGVISIQSYQKNAYQESDITILQTLASYVSIAYLNAQTYLVIEEKNQNITDSLRYAQTIQQALLPTRFELEQVFQEYFLIYLPKDIVSGDFYWFMQVDQVKFIAAVDCTGHGVPGAFMSMIGNEFLNEIIGVEKIYEPAKILERLHTNVRRALRQEENQNTDGMDVCLCRIEAISLGHRKIVFAGARRSLIYTNRGELREEKGDKCSIGGIQRENIRTFQQKELILSKGEIIYLFTDGIVDQNNPQGKRLGSARFFSLIDEIKSLSMREQKALILAELASHQSSSLQRDDITVIGIKI